MATELLMQSPGVTKLNSPIRAERAVQASLTDSLAGLGSVVAREVLFGDSFSETTAWSGPETILLVEDEAFVRKVTAEVLESAGYRLVIAGSAVEALEASRGGTRPVDLLLADVVMPGMNGRELAAEFETLYPRARVLLMSGYAEQLALCASVPYDKKYLAKPFSVPVLLGRVREVLDKNPFEGGARA
jgi:CheY-like chemotaxis protein